MSSSQLWGFLCGLTVIRLALAAWMPLTPDEAYYWVWSRGLQGGYYDHPPMVALWIRIGTALVGQNTLGVRVLGPFSALIGSWCVWRNAADFCRLLGRDVSGAWRAPMLLNATLVIGLGSATMTPDTPLILFLAVAFWALGRVLATGQGIWWVWVGFGFGLGFDSKYTAILPVAGVCLWGVSSCEGRAWLRRGVFWLGFLTAGVAVFPVVWWNATHQWISFLKQGGRAGDWHPVQALGFMGELLGGQIGLVTPLIFSLFCLGVWRLWRLRRSHGDAVLWLWMIGMPVLVFLQHALGDRVQANWPVVVYPACAVVASALTVRIGAACALGLVLTGLAYIQAAFAPLPLSVHQDVFARQMGGWPAFATAVRERVPLDVPLIVPDYGVASELVFYGMPAIGLDTRWQWLSERSPRVRRGMMLVRADERADRKPTGAVVGDTVCRKLRERDIRCYRFYDVTLPMSETEWQFHLPLRP